MKNTIILKIFMAVLFASLFLFVIELFIGYLGDEFKSQAWSEQSVPAPRPY